MVVGDHKSSNQQITWREVPENRSTKCKSEFKILSVFNFYLLDFWPAINYKFKMADNNRTEKAGPFREFINS